MGIDAVCGFKRFMEVFERQGKVWGGVGIPWELTPFAGGLKRFMEVFDT